MWLAVYVVTAVGSPDRGICPLIRLFLQQDLNKETLFRENRPDIGAEVPHGLAASGANAFVSLIDNLHDRHFAAVTPENLGRYVLDGFLSADRAVFFVCLNVTALAPHE